MTGEAQLNHIYVISILKIRTQNYAYGKTEERLLNITLSHFKHQNSLNYERGPVDV